MGVMEGGTVRATWPSKAGIHAEQRLSICFDELSSRLATSPALYMNLSLSEAATKSPTSPRSEVRPAE